MNVDGDVEGFYVDPCSRGRELASVAVVGNFLTCAAGARLPIFLFWRLFTMVSFRPLSRSFWSLNRIPSFLVDLRYLKEGQNKKGLLCIQGKGWDFGARRARVP